MKNLSWLGSSKKDLMKFPREVIQEVGFALDLAQRGEDYHKTKLLKGCGSSVYQITTECDKNAYRVVYVQALSDIIYVLSTPFKKSQSRALKLPKRRLM